MKHLKNFKQHEAIGFKVKGDNRDDEREEDYTPFSKRKRIGYIETKEFDDKLTSIARKLKAMAEGGEPGERDVAKVKLNDLSKKYGVNIDKLLSDTPSRLGFKFSWEDIDSEIEELDKDYKLLSEANEPKVSSKDYDLWYDGKKGVFRKTYCDMCKGKDKKVRKTCIMNYSGGGTLSNPSGHEWLCKKHYGSDELWLKNWNMR